jgi:hypothetical protein
MLLEGQLLKIKYCVLKVVLVVFVMFCIDDNPLFWIFRSIKNIIIIIIIIIKLILESHEGSMFIIINA